MYHNRLTAKQPQNPITSKLLRIAREMNMSFKDLDHWSSIISQDFCSRNPEIAPPTDDILGLTTTLSQVVSQVNMQNTKLDNLVTQCRSRDAAYERLKDETSNLHDELAKRDATLAELHQQLAEKDSRLATFKRVLESPDSRDQRVRQRLEGKMDIVATSTPKGTNNNDVQGVETSNALDGAATMGAGDGHGDAFQMDLRYGAEAAQVNSTKQSLRGLTIQNLLVQCYNGNFLKHSNWSYSAKLALPPTVASGDQSTARYVLELCQYVMDAQEQQDFRLKSFATDEQLQTAADTIQQRAFRKMFQFEGDDPKTEEQLLKKKGSQGKKPTVSGVGSRVRKYKAKYNLKELQEKRSLPPAHHQITGRC